MKLKQLLEVVQTNATDNVKVLSQVLNGLMTIEKLMPLLPLKQEVLVKQKIFDWIDRVTKATKDMDKTRFYTGPTPV